MKRVVRINSLIIFAFVCLFSFISGNECAQAAQDYYVSPSGSGTSCTSVSPCSLATGLGKSLVGDDKLILKNGTYTGTSLFVRWSGTAGHPITIKAENDGQAIVDGQNSREPFRIEGTSGTHKTDITIEGIVFKNSNSSVISVIYADRIILKRVSGYNAAPAPANVHIFNLWNITNVLLEDCSASGTGRVAYDVLGGSYVTLRRCWGAPIAGSYPNGINVGVQIYHSSHCTVENCVVTAAAPNTASAGIYLQNNYSASDVNYTKVYGNIVRNMGYAPYTVLAYEYNIHDNEFKDNVGVGNRFGMYQLGDSNLTFTNNTILSGDDRGGYYISNYPNTTKQADYHVNATVKNNVFKKNGTDNIGLYLDEGSNTQFFTHTYNDISGYGTRYWNITAGTGEITTAPTFDTATYGNGAYLMQPTNLKTSGESGSPMGAEVLYRYVDGVLHDGKNSRPGPEPLWPWPMEGRIKAETGYSVTYESGGGLWKTLNGVYVAAPSPTPGAVNLQ